MRRGYSFPEVLFAVAILGVGFIMIAAIFPVALLQIQTTTEENIGTAVARNGVSYLRGSLMVNSHRLPFTNDPTNPPVTPPATANPAQVFSFNDPRIKPGTAPNDQTAPDDKPQPGQLWDSVKGDLIVGDDSRFAFVPMYVREPNLKFAKAIVVSVRVRNYPEFTAADTTRIGGAAANLEPRPVMVTITDNAGQPDPIDTITIGNVPTGDLAALSAASNATGAAVEGAYVIISNDGVADDTATPFANEHGKLNGTIYHLGPLRGGTTYELLEDVTQDLDAIAFIIGRGYADPANPGAYSGPSMAVQKHENIIALP